MVFMSFIHIRMRFSEKTRRIKASVRACKADVRRRITGRTAPKETEMTYQETAYEVMSRFLTDFTEEELKNCIANAYDEKFDTTEIAPLHKADGAYYLELFHGATIAFKDMALSILPHLLTTSAREESGEE